MMLYLELLAEFGDHFIVEIGTIVRNDPFWYPVSTDQIMSNEPCRATKFLVTVAKEVASTHFVK